MATSRVYKDVAGQYFSIVPSPHENTEGNYASSASSTMIQGYPVELLEGLFEFAAYSDPRSSQATLHSLMLTCSYFRTIARRHLIRIVCLPNEEKVIKFASYLQQVVGGGDYGKSMLPIQHLAVAGGFSWVRNHRSPSLAESKAANIIPFIIATASPTLVTLTTFGLLSNHNLIFTSGSIHPKQPCEDCVINGPTFPKLRDLIALDQEVIQLTLWDNNNNPDKRACQLRYPSLRRLYITGHDGGTLHSSLPYLADLRLDMLDTRLVPPPPREDLCHVRSLIIDGPNYPPPFTFEKGGRRDECNNKYRTLLEEVGNPERNGYVVSAKGFNRYRNRDCILSAWADAVVGGEGCWTTAWVHTK